MKMNNKGFTIIELLISAAILSFLIAGMVIMLLQQQRQFNFTKEISDIDTTGRTLLNFIASEIRNSGARQGKAFSLKFINGGSDPDNLCEQNSTQQDYSDEGTIDSAPDCIGIYTWNLTAGMTNENDGINLPSTTETTLFYSYNGGTQIEINLPENYFDGDTFIGKTYETNQEIDNEDGGENPVPVTVPRDILLGFRSRQSLCNPNIDLQHECLTNTKKCSECAMILRASLTPGERKANAYEVVEHNFPKSLFENATNFNSYITGEQDQEGDGQIFGFIPSIANTPHEFNIVQSKYFRIDTESRGIEMAQNLGDYITIAGGIDGNNNQNILEAPGIVDLQFVFNLEDPDGGVTRVGVCEDGYCDFNKQDTRGREQDIRSVDINLVLKSKIKPQKQSGGFYEQRIPAIADVAARFAPKPHESEGEGQSKFNEPQNGFIYRVFSTTVYLRNLAREEDYR
jgi:prepilin-type N-terminal cleavage/methylation domain-containing protein